MRVRSLARFDTDIPEDDIDEDGDDTQLDGKNVAEAIRGILNDLGGGASAPNYVDEHGWELDIVYGRRQMWAQVTRLDDCSLHFEDCAWFSGYFNRYDSIYLDALRRLGEALAADKRFHNVRWYDDGNCRPGTEAAQPVED